MRYVMNQDDLRGLIDFLGAETKRKGDNEFFRFCPKCGSNAPKDDEWKFSVNWKTGAFGCLRGSCGYHGHFVELCRDVGYKIGLEAEREYRQFPQPEKRIVPRESAIAYLEGRGISRAVAERYEVTAFEDKPNILWFPFFDEYGKLVYAKFRRMNFRKGRDKNKEWTQEGGKPILFGMKQCTDFGTLIITEGQLDSLSVAEAGYTNCCSVPNGMNAFTWIPNCYDWVKKFERVIVFGDLERGRMSLIDQLMQRLPNRIFHVRYEDYLGEKDANDILRAFGVDAIRHCIENAIEPELAQVKELADVQSVDISLLPKIRTGILELDKTLKGGICYGQVVLLTGKRGDGKSTLMSQLMADAIDQDIPCFAYSGELPDFHFKAWLNYQLAGKQNMQMRENEFGEEEYYLDDETDKRISEWYRGKAYIYDNKVIDGDETEKLTEIIKHVITRRGVRLICIDNLMTAMDSVRSQNDLYMAQGNFVDELKKIAVRYNVAVILVAHPRKAGANDDDVFDNDAVSGSSDITNRVDIVLNYSRAKDTDEYDSRLQISKNRLAGSLKLGKDAIPLNYSPHSKRVFGLRSLIKTYGWERQPITVEGIDVPF